MSEIAQLKAVSSTEIYMGWTANVRSVFGLFNNDILF